MAGQQAPNFGRTMLLTYSLATSIKLVRRRLDQRQLVPRDTKLDKWARVGRNLVPAGTGRGVLDPLDKPLVDRISEGLLRISHVRKRGEALVAAMEEGNLSAMGRGRVGRPDNVVVGAEEAIYPGVLGSTAEVLEVVHGTIEAGITVLSATTK